jgi:hypothetical protein
MLGQRIELVTCEDSTKAEHMALLMAMEDAERALTGAIAFRVDSTAVANMVLGKRRHLKEIQDRIKLLLKRHPDWSLVLIEGHRNKVAHSLSRRPFQMDESAAPGTRLCAQRTLSVPAELVEYVRHRLYTVLGGVARDMAQITEEGACAKHPELLTDSRRRYKETCALLEVVGWTDLDTPTDIKVDLSKHARALMRAIEVGLEVADDNLNDVRGETITKCVASLKGLASAVAYYDRRTRKVHSISRGAL